MSDLNIFEVYSKDELDIKFSTLATPENISNINAQLADIALFANNYSGIDTTASTSSSIAIQNALNDAASTGKRKVILKSGSYLLTSMLTIPQNVELCGEGLNNTFLVKGFNGDMIDASATGALVRKIQLLGQGGTYQGRGIIIGGGSEQKIIETKIIQTYSYCIEYTTALAGENSWIKDCILYTNTPTTLEAIKYPDNETNGDRKLINVDCEGGLLANFAGVATVIVQLCNTVGVTFTANSKKVIFVGNRIAGGSIGRDIHLMGTDHVFNSNAIATNIYLDNGTRNSRVKGNTIAGGYDVIDNSAQIDNDVDFQGGAFEVHSGYGKVSPNSNDLTVGAGGSGASAVSLAYGDGTGWGLELGTKVSGTFTPKYRFLDNGHLQFLSLPTSSTGLPSGSLWNNAGVLNIVP